MLYIEIWKKVFKNFKAWWKTKSEYIEYSTRHTTYVFVYDVPYDTKRLHTHT